MEIPRHWREIGHRSNPCENGFRPDNPVPAEASTEERLGAIGIFANRFDEKQWKNYLEMYKAQLKYEIITEEDYQRLVNQGLPERVKTSTKIVYEAPLMKTNVPSSLEASMSSR